MGHRHTGLAKLRIRESNIVCFAEAAGDIIEVRFLVVFPQSNGPLLQLAVAALCPDVGAAVILKADIGALHRHAGDGAVAAVPLEIQVLAHDQALHAVQLHVKIILAGLVYGVGAAAHHVAIVVILHRVFVVDLADGAGPGLAAVHPGGHEDLIPLAQSVLLKLSNDALDPVGPGLLDGDIGRGIALAVGAVLVDGLDAAGNR